MTAVAASTDLTPAPNPAPFLKWAGGKRKLIPALAPYLERAMRHRDFTGTYREPFLGGGAVLFWILSHESPVMVRSRADASLRSAIERAHVGDMNLEFVRTYCAVRDETGALIAALRDHAAEATNKEYFLRVRAESPCENVAIAARMIYLNRTCYNGLYRVNLSGGFNVPFGHYANPRVVDPEGLRACALALGSASVHHEDFVTGLLHAVRGDLVYLDPPYEPATKTANFTGFTAGGFSFADQERVAAQVKRLAKEGVLVVASNSDVPRVRALYEAIEEVAVLDVDAPRAISAKVKGRGNVKEILVVSRKIL